MVWSKRLELYARNRLPSFVRMPLRLGKVALRRQMGSNEIPAELFAGCGVCASRYDLVDRLPKGGCVAEIGTYKGEFASHILTTSFPAELHLVDMDFSLLDKHLRIDRRVRLHLGLSHEVLKTFCDDKFDWIYIDADHSYSGVSRDARAAISKVKPGGFLVFNDFAHIDPFLGVYGVHRAVVEFAVENKWRFAWFAYERHGLYDVALVRPLPT